MVSPDAIRTVIGVIGACAPVAPRSPLPASVIRMCSCTAAKIMWQRHHTGRTGCCCLLMLFLFLATLRVSSSRTFAPFWCKRASRAGFPRATRIVICSAVSSFVFVHPPRSTSDVAFFGIVLCVSCRQWNRLGALSLPSADVLPNLEEEDGGAVLGSAVPGDAAQLHDVGALRAPAGAPAQHARHHHQRHRHGHRARLHRALPHLLRRHRPPPSPPPAGRRGRLRRRGCRARPLPRPHPRPQVHGRRHPLRPLRHRHVRRAALRHENGDPDQERGVHAPVPVRGLARQWHLLDCLRPHPLRPLHHHPQRAGRHVRGGADNSVRHLLQVDAADPGGPQAQGRPRAHDRGRRRRQERQLRQRPLLEAILLTSPLKRLHKSP